MRKINDRDMDNLAAILDYCDRIIRIVERFGNSFEQFDLDEDYRDAVLMNVFQIGEATNRLSDDCKEIMNTVPWYEIYGARNVIAHGYVKVKNEIIWEIVEMTGSTRIICHLFFICICEMLCTQTLDFPAYSLWNFLYIDFGIS